MFHRSSLMLGLFLALASAAPSFAQVPVPNPGQAADEFAAQAQADFQTVSTFINQQFAPNLGFFSTLGWNTPPTLFTWDSPLGPHLEVSAGVGADLFKISDSTLNLSVLDQSTETNPGKQINDSLNSVGLSGLPVPYPFVTARIGLFAGLDVGFRYTEVPNVAVNTDSFNVNAHYSGYGFDLRYKLLEGHGLPNVTMGVHWNTLQGEISLGASVDQTTNYTDSDGNTYTVVVNGNAIYDESWSLNDFGPELTVGYNLLGFFYPYAGIGFERYSGSVSATLKGSTQVTASYPGFPDGTQNIPMNYLNQQPPTDFEAHYLAGLDIGSVWSIVGEANGPSMSLNTSFRAEF